MRCFLHLSALFLLLAAACGSPSSEKKTSGGSSKSPLTARSAVEEPTFSFNDSVAGRVTGKPRALIREEDLPDLTSLLPARIGRYKKIYEKSERSGPEVMLLYSAWAEYNTPEGDAIVLHITDTGQSPLLQKSVAAWADKPMEVKNQYGHERSVVFDGYPGFEKSYGKLSSEVAVLVANRYVVNAACRGCDLDLLREVIHSVPLKRLEVLQ